RVDRDVGAAGDGRQLQLGELEDGPCPGVQLRAPLHERLPDVAADDVGDRCRGEDLAEQCGRRGLALGTGDGQDARLGETQEELDLADQLDAPLLGQMERVAQPWLGRWKTW